VLCSLLEEGKELTIDAEYVRTDGDSAGRRSAGSFSICGEDLIAACSEETAGKGVPR
jgi:hypothetical protein